MEKNKMAFRFASVTEEQILSINEVTVPKLQNWQQTVAVFDGKLFNLFPNLKCYARERASRSEISTFYCVHLL